jgi:AcrR family transcriptional regulator
VRLFARHGFDGTSVQAIADEVGASKQAVLYHFASKEGLRQAVLEDLVQTWRNVLPRFLAALTRPEGSFEEALAEIVKAFRAEPAAVRFLMQELLSGASHPVLDNVDSWLGFAAEFIRRAQDEGTVDGSVDPESWVVTAGTLILATLSFVDSGRRRRVPGEDRLLRELARTLGSSLVVKRKR